MQELPQNILRSIANRLPARNARSMARASTALRRPALESLAARPALDRKVRRATARLSTRRKRILSLVTYVVDALEDAVRAQRVLDRKFITDNAGRVLIQTPPFRHPGLHDVHGWLNMHAPGTHLPARVTIATRVLTSTTMVRGSAVQITFNINPASRQVSIYNEYSSGARTWAERRLMLDMIRKPMESALKANGYAVV